MREVLSVKFSVGYRLAEDGAWFHYLLDRREKVAEVYFPLTGFASGREEEALPGLSPFESEAQKRRELAALHRAGIGMNLLLNGNCYGADALSRVFFLNLGDAVDEAIAEFGVSSVTTTSPVIAKFLKQNFPALGVRASVNMEIGTRDGMSYLADRFDGFYLAREHNRNFSEIRKAKAWCDAHGKTLHLLANSGCLNHCSAHHFHDNLVAHHEEIRRADNAYEFQGVCWEYLRDLRHVDRYLEITNFIRPEDIFRYEEWFDCVKLATRASRHPERTLRAYIEGHHIGSVMNLLEPDHSGGILPLLVENSAIPADFAEIVGNCQKNCETCGYCRKVLRGALIQMEDIVHADC